MVNAIFATLCYFGLHGNKYCWNAFVFVEWMATAIYLIVILGKVSGYKGIPARSAPAWLSCLYDIVLATCVAAFGHFGIAILIMIQQLAEAAVFSKNKSEKA